MIAVGSTAALFASCGGGDNSVAGAGTSGNKIVTTGSNVVSAVVNAGPANGTNTLFVSVTICAHGTTNCQTVDDIQVDTGSSGLRVLASALTISLQPTSDGNGNTYVECTQYVDGYAWGPLTTADVTIGGESASSVPVQIIGSTDFSSVPDACSSTGTAEDTVQTFGANGILGVSVMAQDCGADCVTSTEEPNPFYYLCVTADTGQCTATTMPLASQVPNPVTLFATDNNGVIIELPAVAATGAASVTGSLVFGVDTESNNSSTGSTVLTLDPDTGNLTTDFAGQTDTASFFDSGSNGLFFNDSSLPMCTENTFYCPASTTSLSAKIVSQGNVSVTVDFSVANAEDLFADASLTAFSNLAGPYASSGTFDWGLSFFYGRNVYTVFENASTSAGAGPYVAF
jgi:hypothetical protein